MNLFRVDLTLHENLEPYVVTSHANKANLDDQLGPRWNSLRKMPPGVIHRFIGGLLS